MARSSIIRGFDLGVVSHPIFLLFTVYDLIKHHALIDIPVIFIFHASNNVKPSLFLSIPTKASL